MTISSTQIRGLVDVTNVGALNRTKDQTATGLPSRKRKSEQKVDDAQAPPPLRIAVGHTIDAFDEKNLDNASYCVEYQRSIYQDMKKNEGKYDVESDYMTFQSMINPNMRATLIDWLVEVHLKFKLLPETLFLTVNIMDRYLEKTRVGKNHLQLVGITSMLIASKYEEIYPPEIEDFCNITDNAYNRDQVLMIEIDVLNRLEFNLTVPTSIMFLQRYLTVDGSTNEDLRWKIAHFLLEMTLTEYSTLKWAPTTLASSTLYLTNRLHEVSSMRPPPSWTPQMEDYTKFSEKSLRDCTKEILNLLCLQTAQSTPSKSVFRKYQKLNNGEVIKSIPVQKVLQKER